MAKKNCEDLDYNSEDLNNSESITVGTLELRIDDLPSIAKSEPAMAVSESLSSPKIIVEFRYEDTAEISVKSADNHLHENNNKNNPPKVPKRSNKIHNLVRFFERKHSPKSIVGNMKSKVKECKVVKEVENNSHPTRVDENNLATDNSRLVSTKNFKRQEKVEGIEDVEYNKKRSASWFRRHKAASDDLHLSMLVDEPVQPRSHPQPRHINLPISEEPNDEPNVEINRPITPTLPNDRKNSPRSRYRKSFQALAKMKAAFISGESDEKEEAFGLFQSFNAANADDTKESENMVQASQEPSDRMTPDIVDGIDVIMTEEEIHHNTPDEKPKEKWQINCMATGTKKIKSRKNFYKEELKTKDDKINELYDILTKHVKTIVELENDNERLKNDLEAMALINTKQYELIVHLSKANMDHYQPKKKNSNDKSEQFTKRTSKSLDLPRKSDMPDLIPGTEKAISEDY